MEVILSYTIKTLKDKKYLIDLDQLECSDQIRVESSNDGVQAGGDRRGRSRKGIRKQEGILEILNFSSFPTFN